MVLPRECTSHSKHSLPTAQEMTPHMDITRWSIPKSDWLYSLQPKVEKLYNVSKTRPGADCSPLINSLLQTSDLNWKKLGETTRPFRYDLNKFLWLYNRSDKEIQRIRPDRQNAWRTMDRGSWHKGGGNQNHSPKKKCKKPKWLFEETL